jgi:Co/Zn/Cd efflux system component
MHSDSLYLWQHDHSFGQEKKRDSERRTTIVIATTGTMMVIEIVTGFIFGSMALLADGYASPLCLDQI